MVADAGYEELLALMDAQPDEVGPAVVLADWLQLAGDPRGELIALQLAKESATGAAWEALEERTRAHLATHASALLPSVGAARLHWRRGFVHRVEVVAGMTLLAGTLEQWARHPSMRLWRELTIASDDQVGANLRPLPTSLRRLEVRGSPGPISEALCDATGLQTLIVKGVTDFEALQHPSLVELQLSVPLYDLYTWTPFAAADVDGSDGSDRPAVPADTNPADRSSVPPREEPAGPSPLPNRLAKLSAEALPSLRRFSLEIPTEHGAVLTLDDACRGLAESNLLGALTQLEFVGHLTEEGARALARARADAPKLEWLRVRDATSPQLSRELRAALQPLCRELSDNALEKPLRAARPKLEEPTKERRVRNRFKAAWGVGRVLAESDDGFEVEFEAVGVKLIRSPELLVDVED